MLVVVKLLPRKGVNAKEMETVQAIAGSIKKLTDIRSITDSIRYNNLDSVYTKIYACLLAP